MSEESIRAVSPRLRWAGLAAFVIATAAVFLIMSFEGRVWRAPLFAIPLLFVAIVGLFFAIRIVEPGTAASPSWWDVYWGAKESELKWLAPAFTAPLAAVVFLGCVSVLGVPGVAPGALAAVAILAPASLRRPALFLFLAVCALYLPSIGRYGLWDPWETHYGEVSREIVSRNDWISLWWAQEQWFWSKPIFIFWSEALSLSALNVNVAPDANPLHPEFALRLPHFLIALGGVMMAFKGVGKVFGTRAGLFAGLVLATMPQFFLIGQQAVTDMPLVGNLTMAMGALLLGLSVSEDEEIRAYRVGRFEFSLQHVVIGVIVLLALPQILYLASRNITLTHEFRFSWHADYFVYGSAGNEGVPGNPALRDENPAFEQFFLQPLSQAIWWAAGLAALVWILRKEKRSRALWMSGFYVFASLAFMGKGIPGVILPAFAIFLFVLSMRRFSLLFDGQLFVARGLLTVLVLGMPWFVAMYMRHGTGFTDRLLVHDHINRLAAGVHGDNGSMEYFLEQLGPGMFPWIAFVPVALMAFLYGRRTESASRAVFAERDALVLFATWFVSSFALFSAMQTKFHHYIFPVLPPVALLVGVAISSAFGRASFVPRGKALLGTALGVISPVVVVLGIAATRGSVRGVAPDDVPLAGAEEYLAGLASLPVGVSLIVLGVLLFAGALLLLREHLPSDEPAVGERGWLVGVLAGATIVAFVGRDLAWASGHKPAGYERIMQLFIYLYTRPWPLQFDYRPVLTGFAVVASVLVVAVAFRRTRMVSLLSMFGVASAFALWCLNIYMVDLAPQWGQEGLVKRYYEVRKSNKEPLLAYQMNWKGENFYTGNHVHAFADVDNKKLREWIDKNKGVHVYILLEHDRVGSLKGLLGREHPVREVTDKRFCNKFILVEATL